MNKIRFSEKLHVPLIWMKFLSLVHYVESLQKHFGHHSIQIVVYGSPKVMKMCFLTLTFWRPISGRIFCTFSKQTFLQKIEFFQNETKNQKKSKRCDFRKCLKFFQKKFDTRTTRIAACVSFWSLYPKRYGNSLAFRVERS